MTAAEAGALEGPARILLVEDSETQALELRLLLEAHGFAVERCPSAETALDHLNRSQPDLVVADYHLPGMNGDELIRQMRLSLRTRALPVLMLTGGSGGERQGLESGADAYLPKSADRDLMILRIRALMRERRSASDGEGPGAAAFRRGRILVIDGSATYRTFLSGLLGQDGHHVATADGPEAALAALNAADGTEAFDCVTVDLLGHAYDGLALCLAISQRRAGQAAGAGFHLVAIAGSDPAKDFLVQAYAAAYEPAHPERKDLGIGLRDDVISPRRVGLDEEILGRIAPGDGHEVEAGAGRLTRAALTDR